MSKKILIIGGQGMLGRPVARRLVRDGHSVRVMARNPEAAARVLPRETEVVSGDLTNTADVDRSLHDCSAVYLSVDTTRPRGFSPETDGLSNVIEAARNHGAPRLLVLSALGTSSQNAEQVDWWHLRIKQKAQALARASGLPWTILEPAWFFESLPLFIKGRSATCFSGPLVQSYWIAGDDFASVISNGLSRNIGTEEIIPVQGERLIDLPSALAEFVAAYDPQISVRRLPFALLRLLGLFVQPARELAVLSRHYAGWPEPKPNPQVTDRFGRFSMTVSDYARYCRSTGDFPQK